MIKKLIVLLALAAFSGCALLENTIDTIYRPKVVPELQEQFNRLDSIYKSRGINIDYRKVKSIETVQAIPVGAYPNPLRLEGLYIIKPKAVYVNLRQPFDKGSQIYKDKILMVIAHEIAHSQGHHHSNNPFSIMYPSSQYTRALLENFKVSDMVSAMYERK